MSFILTSPPWQAIGLPELDYTETEMMARIFVMQRRPLPLKVHSCKLDVVSGHFSEKVNTPNFAEVKPRDRRISINGHSLGQDVMTNVYLQWIDQLYIDEDRK